MSALLRFGQQMVDGLLERCRAGGKAIRERVRPRVDTALAAVDVAAVVYTVRGGFARQQVLAEARRHLLETLRAGRSRRAWTTTSPIRLWPGTGASSRCPSPAVGLPRRT
ncbi:hypothetical protein ACWCQW_47545 [Streptomyces mirabilis]